MIHSQSRAGQSRAEQKHDDAGEPVVDTVVVREIRDLETE
jgi:hypothetical protein